MSRNTDKVVYARSTTSIVDEHGWPVQLRQGDAWYAADPLVKQHPSAFTASPLVMTSSGLVPLDEI